jgi:hypothetical protein
MNQEYEINIENIIFDWKFYFVNNSELNEKNMYKKNEVMEYFKTNNESIYNIITKKDKSGINKLLSMKQLNHMLFRYICCNYLSLMRLLDCSKVSNNSKNEAVFIEYRCFPHIEFLIRNSIYKLGKYWSHTVVCGTTNYDYILKIVNKISPNIRVIKTDDTNLTVSEYSKMLTSLKFWESLKGEKILIYQEDSFIFKSNIMDFMEWDYIGAPFPIGTNDTPNGVGNGGLSLRTKSIMMEVINKISPTKTHYNSSTTDYMKDNKLDYPPEDVYFSKNMQELNIGKVADWNTASEFSSETSVNNSFGGHKFWISNNRWLQYLNSSIYFEKYERNSDVGKYIMYKKNMLPNQMDININELTSKDNHFDIDFYFYKKINNLNISLNSTTELCYHFNNFGINGLIYHPQQLINLYPSIKIYNFHDGIIIKNNEKFYQASIFVDKKVYKKTFEGLKEISLFKISENNFASKDALKVSQLLVLVFIGNINIGSELLEKIIQYKEIQEFSIAFCFNSLTVMEYFKDKIEKKFNDYIIYRTKEYGTDITSSLLTYYDISLKYKFKYIIKLHTKTVRPQFDELVNFLLQQPVENILKLKTPNCNCIGNEKHYMSVVFQKNVRYDIFNKILLERYKSEIDKNKQVFVAGTIFLTEAVVFDSVINFFKNNYHSFLLNNLYENNSVNMDNSPIHFLERLFGIIRTNC